MQTVEKILASIQDAYGSLEEPNFGFVSRALKRQPYRELLMSISHLYSVEEDTDENDDVSFGYILRSSTETCTLRISMVGPYCILLHVFDDGTCSLIEPSKKIGSPSAQRLVEALTQAGLHLLDEHTLLVPVDLALSNTEPDNRRIFQALFTDTDIIPWVSSTVSPR